MISYDIYNYLLEYYFDLKDIINVYYLTKDHQENI